MAYTQSFGFGTGFLYFTPQSGLLTPVRIGIMQNVSVDFSFDEKPLHGQFQFPVAVARGKGKITCKSAFALMDSKAIGTIFLGGTPAVGQDIIIDAPAETHTMTSTGYQVINHTNFVADLGVYYATTGQPLTQVTAGSETTASYSESNVTGTYVVSSADSSAVLLFTYKYTSAGGDKTSIVNQPMGTFIPFTTDLFVNNPNAPNVPAVPTPTTQTGIRFYKCMSTKLTMATKLDDWTIPDMDFSVFADNTGRIMDWNTVA